MSTGQYVTLCTEEERVVAVKAAWGDGFKRWQPYSAETFHFGDTDDNITLGISPKIFDEIGALKPKVDDVYLMITQASEHRLPRYRNTWLRRLPTPIRKLSGLMSRCTKLLE